MGQFILLSISLLVLRYLTFSKGELVDFDQHLTLDSKGIYDVWWKIIEDQVYFKLQVKTTGWIGFGFSPSGKMEKSDVIIVWIKDGKTFMKDRHALGNYLPVIDKQQDYHYISSNENSTHTTVIFKRKLNTCDEEDYVLNNDTVKIIYSWNPNDPEDEDNILKHEFRGTRSVMLNQPNEWKFEVNENITPWDIFMDKVPVPAKSTTYWCKMFKAPKLSKKHHYIGFNMSITPGNEQIVHHLLVFQCKGDEASYEAMIGKVGFDCGGSLSSILAMKCVPPLLVWAVGSVGQLLPNEVGITVGAEYDGFDYFLMQMHYDNPEERSDIVDSSGARAYLSPDIRPMEASTIMATSQHSFNMVIPPLQSSFKVVNYCSPKCTDLFPESGITITSVLLHGHKIIRKIRLRHFRDGVELPVVAEDNNYDFNFQGNYNLQKPATILRGDTLISECEYDSSERTKTTLGGQPTHNEMCLIYMNYYPKILELGICYTSARADSIIKFFGVEELQKDGQHVSKPDSLYNQSMDDIVENFNWETDNKNKIDLMQSIQLEPKQGMCVNDTGAAVATFIQVYPGPRNNTKIPCKKKC